MVLLGGGWFVAENRLHGFDRRKQALVVVFTGTYSTTPHRSDRALWLMLMARMLMLDYCVVSALCAQGRPAWAKRSWRST